MKLVVIGVSFLIALFFPTQKRDTSESFVSPLLDRSSNAVSWAMIAVSNGGVQGDAHLISSGSHHLLIDGGEYERAKSTLLPFLRTQKIGHLNQVIVTHPHFDHYGGVIALLEANFSIGEIFWPDVTNEGCLNEPWGCRVEEIQKLIDLAHTKNIPLKSISRDLTEINIGPWGQLKKIAQFPVQDCPVPCDLNDTSLVAKLTVGRTSVLFTGDLNQSLGSWLTTHRPTELKAQILKVPHHGAEDTVDSKFIETVGSEINAVPTHELLWCSKRSERIRVLERKKKTYTSWSHGNIVFTFNQQGNFEVRYDRYPPKDTNCPTRD